MSSSVSSVLLLVVRETGAYSDSWRITKVIKVGKNN